jgi:hypothetical protein
MYCPNCGHKNPAGATFCVDCGKHLSQSIRPKSRDAAHLKIGYWEKHGFAGGLLRIFVAFASIYIILLCFAIIFDL